MSIGREIAALQAELVAERARAARAEHLLTVTAERLRLATGLLRDQHRSTVEIGKFLAAKEDT